MKRFLALACAIFVATIAMAQPPMGQGPQGGKGNRMTHTIDMLKEQLNMSQQQAEKFAPVYQGYQREIRGVRKEMKLVTDHYKSKPLDIKTAVKIMNAQLNADKQIIQIKKEYIKVFQQHLTPEQLSKVFVIRPRPRRAPGGEAGRGPRPYGEGGGNR